ncbi:hypothetical protein RHS03_08335, partial [Rhizoctonia solani]
MSHPPFWIVKHFFYPIGNTAAVSLTQDLSSEQYTADILLLGCGDPRNILFTLYSDLTVGQTPRNFDVTRCDIEPAILARDILLFSLLDRDENIDRVWDIFYHFKINNQAMKIIATHSQTLYEYAKDTDSWKRSRAGSFIKTVDTRTLGELRRIWKSYADFPRLSIERKNQILKEQVDLSSSVAEKGSDALSPSRSAGMLWPQAMTPVAELYSKYWKTGTTFTLALDLSAPTNLNPTFLYSLSGEGFSPHYGTFPSVFHFITAFAPIKSDPAFSAPSTARPSLMLARNSSRHGVEGSVFAGRMNPLLSVSLQEMQFHFAKLSAGSNQLETLQPAKPSAPTTFDIIDTSNLTDHLGLLNLLLATHTLLKRNPDSQAVLFTETLLPAGKDATKPLTVSFESEPLARVLYGVYDNMFANEKITNMMSDLSVSPNGLRLRSEVHFHRETVALLFQALSRRIHLRSGSWEEVANQFIHMCQADESRILESNCYQDIYLQFHLCGIFTVDILKPNWATDLGLRVNPRSAVFKDWSSLPPVVCLVLTVPRRRLGVFTGKPERIGTPTLQCAVSVPGSHDNIISAIHLVWGKYVKLEGCDRLVVEEDHNGQRGQSALVVLSWVSTRILEFPGTQVALRLKSTPSSTFLFMDKLGVYLEVFGTNVTDREHVNILAYWPALVSDSCNAPSLEPLRPLLEPSSEHLCDAVVTGLKIQRVDSLSIRFDVKNSREQIDLQNGAIVSAKQVSPCTVELKIGSHCHLLSYPYPIYGKNNKVRIARKSLYVEVIFPVSTPNDYSGYFLSPAPVINVGACTTWNLHHINLAQLPTLDVTNPTKVDWLNALTALQLSEREKVIRNGDETEKHASINASINMKDSIHAITMNFSGIQGHRTRTIGLC